MKRTILKTCRRLILASGSPRRKQLLEELGLEFEVKVADVEETPLQGETPADFAMRAACDKTCEVAEEYNSAWVLGADTVVAHGGRILGKPADAGEAFTVLQSLSGQKHTVHTGFCLANHQEDVVVNRVVTTSVVFSAFSGEIAAAYVATGEPLDKAGGYGIQGQGGFLVREIAGSYSNVVGLPLAEVLEELMRYGVVAPVGE